MEKLKFFIEDRAIAELLGRQSFTKKETAVLELIKNSYDAGADKCEIIFSKDFIKIIDNGKGMSLNDLKTRWMSVGNSKKEYMDNKVGRIQTGSKGIGRFALARLSDEILMTTKMKNSDSYSWKTNWEESIVDQCKVDYPEGCSIVLQQLRDKWKEKDVEELSKYLSRIYKSEIMEIALYYEDSKKDVKYIFSNLKIGEHYVTKINLKFDCKTMNLYIDTISDEFLDNVEAIVNSESYKGFSESYNMLHELNSNFVNEDEVHKVVEDKLKTNQLIDDNEKKKVLKDLGDFEAELYFLIERSTKQNSEKFLYKHTNLSNRTPGVVLYRNDFSISSHEGLKDWLGLDSRARRSPAAASHPTGAWRVRSNQLFGAVLIDKKENDLLIDLANRQGLDENDHYEMLKNITNFGISMFERHRQSIIRKIDKHFSQFEDKIINKNIELFIKNPDIIFEKKENFVKDLASEVKVIKKSKDVMKREIRESEKKHIYDVRILNVLATQGLRSSAIAHELRNERSYLDAGYEFIKDALIKFGYWDDLNSSEKTKHAYNNVPAILERLNLVNRKLINFLNIMLNKIEKKKFKNKVKSLENLLITTRNIWMNEYKWIKIEFEIFDFDSEMFFISEDVIEVIFDNLILNTIQHNEMEVNIEIKIDIRLKNDKLNIKYKDNGKGLHSKFVNNPLRILDVHETSRDDGHGLGMWIINNTINMYDGEILEINGNDGFEIKLYLRSKE